MVRYMNGFGIFMIIFASLTLLTGLYMYTGHKIGLLEYRIAFKNLTKNDWKKIGKYTIIVSIIIFLIGIFGIIFNFE